MWTLIWIIVTPNLDGTYEFTATSEPFADFATCAEKLAEKEAELRQAEKQGMAYTIECEEQQ